MLAVISELIEKLCGPQRELDATWFFGMIGIVIPDVVEMRELGADAAEIIPDTSKDGLDLFRGFFRECSFQIVAADPVLAQPSADEAGDAAEQVGGLDRIEIARGAQHAARQRADGAFGHRLGRLRQAPLGTKEQAGSPLR